MSGQPHGTLDPKLTPQPVPAHEADLNLPPQEASAPAPPPLLAASAPRRASLTDRLLAHVSRETTSGRFIPEMDGLRFAAIAMVVLFHLNGYFMVKSPAYTAAAIESDWLGQAALVGFRGVELFFVISGFILALPFAAHHLKGSPAVSLRKYYLRRLTRLEPPYIVALVGLTVLAMVAKGRLPASFYPHFAASLFYQHSLIYGTLSPALGVAWSLEIEVQFYLLVPLLTLLFLIKNAGIRRAVIAGLILATLTLQTLFLHNSPRISLSILGYLQFFLVGFLLADIFLALWRENPRRSLVWDLAALAGWPLLFLLLRSTVLTHWLFPGWLFALYCLAFLGKFTNALFSNRWITAIGGMCYSIYLIHYDVISFVARASKTLAASAPYWVYLLLQFLLVGSVVVVSCGVYFILIEKPCMQRDWPQRLWNYSRRLFARPTVAGVEAAE